MTFKYYFFIALFLLSTYGIADAVGLTDNQIYNTTQTIKVDE